MSRGYTQFPRRAYPFFAEGIPDFREWLFRQGDSVQVNSPAVHRGRDSAQGLCSNSHGTLPTDDTNIRIYFCQHDDTDDTDCHASLSLACSHPAGQHKRSACAISEISVIALTKASCHPERRERSRPSVLEISRRFQAAEAALLGEPEGSFVATDAHFASAK